MVAPGGLRQRPGAELHRAQRGPAGGPAIAGLLIATTGVGVAFVVNAVSFAAVLVGLLRMDPRALRPRRRRRGPGQGQAREGLRYVLASPDLRAVLLLVGVVGAVRAELPRRAAAARPDAPSTAGAEAYGYLTAALGLRRRAGRAVQRVARDRDVLGPARWPARPSGWSTWRPPRRPTLVVAYAALVALGFANIVFNTIGRTRAAAGQRSRDARTGARPARAGLPGLDAVRRAAAGLGLRASPARGRACRRGGRGAAGRGRRGPARARPAAAAAVPSASDGPGPA